MQDARRIHSAILRYEAAIRLSPDENEKNIYKGVIETFRDDELKALQYAASFAKQVKRK